jgi:hypothetical protein
MEKKNIPKLVLITIRFDTIKLREISKRRSHGCNRHKPLAAFAFKPLIERRP